MVAIYRVSFPVPCATSFPSTMVGVLNLLQIFLLENLFMKSRSGGVNVIITRIIANFVAALYTHEVMDYKYRPSTSSAVLFLVLLTR